VRTLERERAIDASIGELRRLVRRIGEGSKLRIELHSGHVATIVGG
jgi:hypothetical protein